jgi:hypothetical protein
LPIIDHTEHVGNRDKPNNESIAAIFAFSCEENHCTPHCCGAPRTNEVRTNAITANFIDGANELLRWLTITFIN